MADDGAQAGPSSDATAAAAQAQALAVVPRSAHGLVPQLQNTVATVNLDTRLDLKSIALHSRNSEYNPKVKRRRMEKKEERVEENAISFRLAFVCFFRLARSPLSSP